MSKKPAPVFVAETDDGGRIWAVWLRTERMRAPRILREPRKILNSFQLAEFHGADPELFRFWAAGTSGQKTKDH
jgi:hypothetical protein